MPELLRRCGTIYCFDSSTNYIIFRTISQDYVSNSRLLIIEILMFNSAIRSRFDIYLIRIVSWRDVFMMKISTEYVVFNIMSPLKNKPAIWNGRLWEFLPPSSNKERYVRISVSYLQKDLIIFELKSLIVLILIGEKAG